MKIDLFYFDLLLKEKHAGELSIALFHFVASVSRSWFCTCWLAVTVLLTWTLEQKRVFSYYDNAENLCCEMLFCSHKRFTPPNAQIGLHKIMKERKKYK